MKTSRGMLPVGLCVLALVPASLAQESRVPVDSLTIAQAVQLALDHHPSLRAAEASRALAGATLRQSRSGLFPAVQFTAAGTHTEGAFVFNPVIPPRQQKYNSYTTGLQFQQTILDLGKTWNRMAANDYFLEASGQDVTSARAQVVANVETSYYTYVQSQLIVRVNEEALQQTERHLAQAKAFFAVGRRPRFDVTKAEVDVANANVNLIRTRNAMRIARLQLETAMGVHCEGRMAVTGTFETPRWDVSLDTLKTQALQRRPELGAARARLSANQTLITAAKSLHLPTLSLAGSYLWSGFDMPLYSRWTAGVTLNFPIFQGFSVSAQVEQAEATAEASLALLDILTEAVLFEVEQSYLALHEAEERILATTKLVEQAEENLVMAEKQYAAGVGTVIEIADAQLTRSNARITNIQAMYDYDVSLINLRRAVGL